MTNPIPIHDFSTDNIDSIPFRLIPLNSGSGYDTTHPHRHNYYEIFFFTKGGGTHTIDFEEIPICDHTLHFVSPGQVHKLLRDKEAYGHIIMFSRDFYYLSNTHGSLFDFPFLNNSYILPALQTNTMDYKALLSILALVESEVNATQHNNSEILGNYLHLILLKCRQLFDGVNKHTISRDTTLFYQLRMLVEKNYRTDRQPASYASELNVSEKKLNEICKEYTNANVSEFIKSRVLLEAKRLLSNSDYSIKEVGYFLGFDDPSYFNRFFKTNTGITAGAFRK